MYHPDNIENIKRHIDSNDTEIMQRMVQLTGLILEFAKRMEEEGITNSDQGVIGLAIASNRMMLDGGIGLLTMGLVEQHKVYNPDQVGEWFEEQRENGVTLTELLQGIHDNYTKVWLELRGDLN